MFSQLIKTKLTPLITGGFEQIRANIHTFSISIVNRKHMQYVNQHIFKSYWTKIWLNLFCPYLSLSTNISIREIVMKSLWKQLATGS